MPAFTPYDLLNRKRRGEELPPEAIAWFVDAFMRGEVADYQMTAFLMAVAIHEMTEAETVALTSAMVASGDRWEVASEVGFVADKHSTGGVGDKISLVLAPWVAACGVRIGMLSGRGLGHTGGTLDKLETIPGFDAHLDREALVRCLGEAGCCIATSTDRIAPADRRMYGLRDVTGTVVSLPLITASIMAKKLAFGASFLLLDVKTGSGAFMSSIESAEQLGRSLVTTALRENLAAEVMITDMDRPLGLAIGNANETAEAFAVLAGKGPGDVRALARAQAERILLASGRFGPESAAKALDEAIAGGAALETAKAWIAAQRGDASVVDHPDRLGAPRHRLEVRAPRSGFIDSMETWRVGALAVELGAGRRRHDDEIDPTAGIDLVATIGDEVRAGDPIAILGWSRDGVHAEDVAANLLTATAITAEPPPSRALVLDLLTEVQHAG